MAIVKKLIYFFGSGKADGTGTMKDLLGGKGAGLAEMTNAGVPVPPGFTITTEVCNLFYDLGKRVPDGLDGEMRDYMKKMEDALGGKFRAEGTVQAAFPLGLPEEYQIRGRVFSDFGTLTGTDFEDDIDLNDDATLRLSVGVGLTWVSPFGPLAVDLAYPVLKESYDEDELFRFSVGTSF